MNGRVNTYEEFLREEQVDATGIISWLDQPGVPEPVPMPNIPGLPPFETAPNARTPRASASTASRCWPNTATPRRRSPTCWTGR